VKKKILKVQRLFLLFLFLPYVSVIAQNEQFTQREIPRDSLLMYARTIIDSAKCRVLISVDETGKPQARTMSPFTPEDNWVIWLGTFPASRKVKQIQKNPNVIVYYYDTQGMSYVSVSGKAKIVNDPTLKAKYWVEGWKKFYPNKDKDYILIEVTPERLEICSFKYGLFWKSDGTPLSVEFRSDNKK